MSNKTKDDAAVQEQAPAATPDNKASRPAKTDTPPVEIGGRDGPDPTRFGDWEKNGRCIDF